MPTAVLCLGLALLATAAVALEPAPWVETRGIYGGLPRELMTGGRTLAESGVNAIWIGSGGVTDEAIRLAHEQGAKVYAEFNTMHDAAYLKEHPDAAPVGTDGQPCPPPEGWQGVSPHHEGYRRYRMDAFRALLRKYPVDGVWLDYHHSHASWERAEPVMPDTGFEPYALAQFQRDTGIVLPARPVPELAELLLTRHRDRWVQWRCDVFTDWVREFRQIVDEERPRALLGTFHCPWTDRDRDGALRNKLHLDLKAQAQYLDVFSPMPYHARFGHHRDVKWISRQTAWLGRHLGVTGQPGERWRIWPIVQVADWGQEVPAAAIEGVIHHGTRRPATGVLVFHWSGLQKDAAKARALQTAYLDLAP